MLEPAVVLLRLVQYAGAMILFGSSLFFLYALPRQGPGSASGLPWSRGLLGWSAAALFVAAMCGLVAQTSILAGSFSEALKPDSISAVMTTMAMGPSSLVRAGAAAVAFAIVAAARASRTVLMLCVLLGAIASASFAWMGHGAATEGSGHLLHAIADIVHSLAAGVWIGALVVFLVLLGRGGRDVADDRALHRALHGFSGVGSALVAVLVASGLVNSWFLVGPSRISGLWSTGYGQLLSLKLLLFAGMLVLAAANRFRLTPALAKALDADETRSAALADLRRSLLLETALSFLVLALVAWLGTLAPISAE